MAPRSFRAGKVIRATTLFTGCKDPPGGLSVRCSSLEPTRAGVTDTSATRLPCTIDAETVRPAADASTGEVPVSVAVTVRTATATTSSMLTERQRDRP